MDARSYELVADALEYPGPLTEASARAAACGLEEASPDLASALDALADFLATAPAGEPEERYTALFDLSPVCTLHLGYHLFGETYQRGSFLAHLRLEMRNAGVEAKDGELADHVSNALRILPRLASDDERATFVDQAFLPALSRMSAALGDSTAPWAAVLRALPSFVAPLGTGEPAMVLLPSVPQQEVPIDA
jgi:nitrate reductase delta subunit